jgi:3-oxoacyl-[acyl-carrier protein] reductase
MPKLQDKVALVTGASKGIGAGIARELAASGAAVAVNYASDRAGAEAVVSAITASGGRAIALPGNVSMADDVARLLAETVRTLGTLDVLVNNAGVYSPTPLEAVTEGEFHRQINTNVLGPLLVMRESLNHFGPAGGSVINVGSAASRMYAPGFAVYTASKAALDALTGVLAKELAARRIRVNSVNPGATLSEGTKAAGLYGVGSEFEKQLVAMTPLGRVGTPADIAKVVAFLASDDSGWLTGEIVLATGGLR